MNCIGKSCDSCGFQSLSPSAFSRHKKTTKHLDAVLILELKNKLARVEMELEEQRVSNRALQNALLLLR